MLSLRELRRAAAALEATLAGLRLDKSVQIDDRRVVLTFSGQRMRRHLLLSCDAREARVSELAAAPAAAAQKLPFEQYLRAHVLGARFAGARIVDDDRQLALALDAREGRRELLLSILGGRSNLYLLDAAGRVEASLRPLAETMRGLVLGAPWRSPEKRPPTEGEDRFEGTPAGGLLGAIERVYAERERGAARAEASRTLEVALAREAAGAARKLAKLRGDLAETGDPDEARRQGELLKGALHDVRPGAASVRARDPGTGGEVEIALDPALGPAENLERCFTRYRKAKRRSERLAGEIAGLEARAAEVAAVQDELRAAAASDDPGVIAALTERSVLRALLTRARPQPPPRAPSRKSVGRGADALPSRLRPRRYRSADGLEIWVGRSDEGNDRLSTRLARGHDVFLHVEGGAGSHVILRTEGRRDAPQESLLDACELAVHFSKQRGAARAHVHVAPAKDVSKPARAKPGLVHVRGGREITLRHEPARLARVLAARIEDA